MDGANADTPCPLDRIRVGKGGDVELGVEVELRDGVQRRHVATPFDGLDAG